MWRHRHGHGWRRSWRPGDDRLPSRRAAGRRRRTHQDFLLESLAPRCWLATPGKMHGRPYRSTQPCASSERCKRPRRTAAAAAMDDRMMGKGRLEAFSDGVIAIVITIMVLELK